MLLYKSINGGFMNNLEFNLMKAKSICDGKFIYCEPYSRIYTFTTENINGYIKYFDLKNKSCMNCTNGSCKVEYNEKVGVDEYGKPQGSDCSGWFNAELIGRSKVLRKTDINKLR